MDSIFDSDLVWSGLVIPGAADDKWRVGERVETLSKQNHNERMT